MRVDQYVPDFAPFDAIGNHALQVRKVLREAGYESDIWAERIHPPLEGEARYYLDDTWGDSGREGRLLLYQHSTSSPMAGWLHARTGDSKDRAGGPERLVSHYHNITPAWYFDRWDRAAASSMRQARAELVLLARSVELALADSAYNEDELRNTGYARTVVCPILVDLDDYHRPPDRATLDRLRFGQRGHAYRPGRGSGSAGAAGGAQWLFVGRIAPNKCQHDVIAAFAAYHRLIDPAARLALVGSAPYPRYLWAIRRLAEQLCVGEGLEILSGLRQDQLLAHWAVADVFVCLSEHEGFCVPMLEAMELGVPVVAFAAAAVPETLGGSGILLEGKDPLTVATAVEKACRDGSERERIVAAGRRRAAHFSLRNTSKQLLSAIEGLACKE